MSSPSSSSRSMPSAPIPSRTIVVGDLLASASRLAVSCAVASSLANGSSCTYQPPAACTAAADTSTPFMSASVLTPCT